MRDGYSHQCADGGGSFDWNATDAFPRAAAESFTAEPPWVKDEKSGRPDATHEAGLREHSGACSEIQPPPDGVDRRARDRQALEACALAADDANRSRR